MELGELPRQSNFTVAEAGEQVLEGGEKFMRRFVENQGVRVGFDLFEVLEAVFAVGAQEALEGEARGGQAAHTEG